MWSILSAIISAIAAFFGARKGDAEKEQKTVINESSRASAEISRTTSQSIDDETTEAAKQNSADAERVRNAGSVSERTAAINDAIRRANDKAGR
ncbi:TPA: hypothetical protein MCN14_003843 [Klebsiella pneumoniae]|uniref:hypothetical protein n=1 Tax=Klebsiella pneumoniae TaxID=573 RepID=UPI000A765D3E|nr:hypothetical protein [Klebsiella pneumoniae]EIV3891952.1 hypothetical protein [Klebsiella pneumoniae]EIW4854877.1 hypothetical protein [Klebsiella pneumoniae]EKX9571742.1 hypothetical protein [Klebsiella pneumoniae]EKX9580261.1 hypothetical protein [Klebsiella pneumoniae]EKX9652806.1 hypothetical protein [Klebsiella pneumoniae]